MSSYGRNFDFRVTPKGGQRQGRYFNDDSAAIPIGAPVVATSTTNALGCRGLELATGAQDAPLPGKGGIIVFEYAWNGFAGTDPVLTTYSDLGTAPVGKACQLISGEDVKVVLRNTTATSFLFRDNYPTARKMVAGVGGATPTVAVGDYLTPGTGNDSAGYWAETATASQAWLVVTGVNNTTGEIEARLNF